jgi:O-methyltransferase involved in polyketide biosynthesis
MVTLGAGLCTRFLRFDNGQACWFSVDLPPAALRVGSALANNIAESF